MHGRALGLAEQPGGHTGGLPRLEVIRGHLVRGEKLGKARQHERGNLFACDATLPNVRHCKEV